MSNTPPRPPGSGGPARPDPDGDHALDPQRMLALIDAQQHAVDGLHLRPVAWLYSIWAVAWFVGYLLLWSAYDGGNPWFRVSTVAAGWTFGVLIGSSILASILIGTRMGRGVRGLSSFQGGIYGWSWAGLSTAVGVLGSVLAEKGGWEVSALYFPSAYAVVAGAMYLFGAALWHYRSQLVLGTVLLAAAAIAPFAGVPGTYGVMAIAGIAFGVAALVTIARLRRNGRDPARGELRRPRESEER
ncbi:hypothetical protein [Pseudactinotalea sp. HY158]|uniref:hypothetical protein n=1 Tax=Pseudactinotalea sp. HY158 TaxID=2654547 RepID=UPI00129CE378|nr:hypothetical protein [Pseudactinotalea sp. HY158]QGH68567.1 hypothetical protein GCE65_02870 [Pseudactinotalea sp. HY158]